MAWHFPVCERTNHCIVDKRTPSLRGEVLGADTTGPAVARVGTIQLNWSAYCPKRDQFAFRRPESSALRVGVGHQPKAMEEDRTASRGARAQGASGVHSASWGNPRGGGRAGGELKPEVKVTMGGDRPLRLGVMSLPSKICVNFLLPTRSTSSRCISQTTMEETGYSRGGESW